MAKPKGKSNVAPSCELVAYYRVSTDKQGLTRLGLDAQRETVARYAQQRACVVVASYEEVESGKRDDRPELAKALAHAKRIGARLVIAKMDRLSRNAGFLLGLVESKADIVFCDLPDVPPGPMGQFILTQMAAVAALERGLISQRTTDAMAVKRQRGATFGTPANLTPEAKAKGALSNRHKAMGAYATLSPTLCRYRASGMSYQAIADRLNVEGVTTRNGSTWTATAVKRVTDRTERSL